MATILLSTLLHPDGEAGAFFKHLMSELQRYEHNPILWAPTPIHGLEDSHLPLPYSIWDWTKYYPVSHVGALDARAEKWISRLRMMNRQISIEPDARELYSIIKSSSEHIMQTLKPDLFAVWNPYEVRVGIFYEMCKERGVPTISVERSCLPNAWHLDKNGLHTKSTAASLKFSDMITSKEKYTELGNISKRYFSLSSLEKNDRYSQNGKVPQKFDNKKTILFLTTDDTTAGIYPENYHDREVFLPFFKNSLDAARSVALSHPDKQIFIKTHPNMLHLTTDENLPPNAKFVDAPPIKLIMEADAIISMGGSLTVIAMEYNKPIVHLPRDALSQKGIFFEPDSVENLGVTIDAALAATGDELAERRQRFHSVCGYLLTKDYICYPKPFEGLCDIEQAVKRLLSCLPPEKLGPQAPPPPFDRSMVIADRSSSQRLNRPSSHTEKVRSILGATRRQTVFLDFDHTLFSGNTTEEYLRQARPAFLVSVLLAFVRGFIPWRQIIGRNWFRFRDYAAVVLVTILMPWNLLRWRRHATKIFEARGSHPLAEAMKIVPADRTVIVSFGFDLLIGPLLKGSHWETCRRRCTPFIVNPRRLRRGKFDILQADFSAREIATAALVTDSEDDRDLLERVKTPLLVEPVGESIPAEEDFYFPMRYTGYAKYSAGHVFDQTFFVELPLLLLATLVPGGPSLVWAEAVFLLFFSMLAVYEIGYFENDQFAALRETQPTLKPEAQRYRHFPLARHAWIWGGVMGAVGCGLLATAPDSTTFDFYSFAKNLELWIAALLVTRGIFALHNRNSERNRVLIYPLLQGAKIFGPLTLLPSSTLGIALMFGQCMAMWTSYAIYRSGGDKAIISREDVRIIVFVALTSGLLLSQPSHVTDAGMLTCILIPSWLALQRWRWQLRRHLGILFRNTVGRLRRLV